MSLHHPYIAHGVGEVDEEYFHVCSITVAHSSIENLYIKRLGYTIYYAVHKYKVDLEGSFQTLYMNDMQKDIPNILHACTCCGVYIWFSTDATI